MRYHVKNISIFFIMSVILFVLVSTNAYAGQNIKVYIDGELLTTAQPAVIKDGSTMVPYRDIFEKLGASVDYNADTKVVTGFRGKERIEMKIGDINAYVNGVKRQLSNAPYVVNGHTMVPLRFVSEALGADVKWDNSTYTVNISTAPYRGYILGFYAVRSYPQFERRAGNFSEASTLWFNVDKDGSIKQSLPDGYENVSAIADESNTKLSAMFFGSRETVSPVLADANLRSFLAKNIVDTSVMYKYDGINIDFEGLESNDRDNFISFLRELKGYATESGLKLTVSLHAMTEATTWYQGYNFKEIGNIADDVVLMAYDYHNPSTTSGPIAPYWWVNDAIEYAIDNGIPAEKILLGIGFYGYDWSDGGSASTLTIDEVINKLGGMQYNFDSKNLSPYFEYVENGVKHIIWFEDGDSIDLKLKLIRMYGLKGAAFWRIGTISESQMPGFNMWDVINKNLAK